MVFKKKAKDKPQPEEDVSEEEMDTQEADDKKEAETFPAKPDYNAMIYEIYRDVKELLKIVKEED